MQVAYNNSTEIVVNVYEDIIEVVYMCSVAGLQCATSLRIELTGKNFQDVCLLFKSSCCLFHLFVPDSMYLLKKSKVGF